MLKPALCLIAVVFALLFLYSFMPRFSHTVAGKSFFWVGQIGLAVNLIALLSIRKRPRD